MIKLTRYILLGLHFVSATLVGLALGLLRPFHPTNSRCCARLYGNLGLKLIGLSVDVIGTENYPKDRAFVVICNHQSNWDLFVVGQAVPKRTVSVGKKSLKWIPFFGQLYWLAGNVLIDRANHTKAMQSMEQTKRALIDKNTNIWFFAEGTRNHGNNMLPFKKGAFITAINAEAPIVPVCVSPYLKQLDLNRFDNGHALIKVLPAIETTGLGQDDTESLVSNCHSLMLNTIESLENQP